MELLVAIVVLSILIVAVAQIVATASRLVIANSMKIDANTQARTVFDRMANDFSRMVKRNDVDFIFWKNTGVGNDAMYFYTEGACYFDAATFSTGTGYLAVSPEKDTVSLVGYRVNNNGGTFPSPLSSDPDYYQMERLGKALSWDGSAYNSTTGNQLSQTNSNQPNFLVFLTYPPAGIDVGGQYNAPGLTAIGVNYGGDPTGVSYSTAFFNSTLAGAFSDGNGALPSAVGTEGGGFNDSTDTNYHTVGSQVFRFEYSFLLKDGTQSIYPVMGAATSSNPNGVPFSIFTGGANGQRPLPTDDSANTAGDGTFAVGSRWYDPNNQIGYICLDATPNYAVWHEIGIQDISAIVVTIAVISKQGVVYANAKNIDLATLAAAFPNTAYTTNGVVTANVAQTWQKKLLPGGGASSSSKLPQSIVSQIRVYQRYFYLNNL